jgi:hypothetical protein
MERIRREKAALSAVRSHTLEFVMVHLLHHSIPVAGPGFLGF